MFNIIAANKLNGLTNPTKRNENVTSKFLNQDVNHYDNNVLRPHTPDELTRLEDRKVTANKFANEIKPHEEELKLTPLTENELPRKVEVFCKLNREMIDATPRRETELPNRKEKLLSPILTAISNFNLAKKLHRENLEHNPLPDTITDRLYRKMQMQRQGEPGLAMEDKHFATGKIFLAIYCLFSF